MNDRSTKYDDLWIEKDVRDEVIVLPDVEELRREQARAEAATRAAASDAPHAARIALFLLIGVCVLNSVDAILTSLVVGNGLATEWNPVVTSMGLLPKLLLVPIAAEIVYLLKPKALWVPFVALSLVVAYTALGFFLSV
ncbi:MAG: hypothetical protein QOH90_1393 [Actinomycetota bacterium]|nr:hypothetical protein [Actinomycetota bacterium]